MRVMCSQPTHGSSPLKFWLLLGTALGLAIASQFLPIAISTSKAEVSQRRVLENRQTVIATKPSAKRIYFPRLGEARRCFITSPDACIFRNPLLPVSFMDLNLEYRKAVLLAEIAAKYAAAKNYDRATLLAQALREPLPKVAALTAIAALNASSGQTESAQQLLAEALQTAKTAGSHETRVVALRRIAAQYAASGQSEAASRLFQLALDNVSSSNRTYYMGEVAVGLLAVGRTAEAEKMTRQLLQAFQNENPPPPTNPLVLQPPPTVNYSWVLRPLLDAGYHDFAIRMVKEVSNPAFRNRWLSDISSSLADSEEYERAIQLAQTIPNERLLSSLTEHTLLLEELNNIVELAEVSNFSDALAKVELIPLPYYRALTLTEIAIKYADAGQGDRSKQTLSRAVEIARTIEGINENAGFVEALVSIPVRLAEVGKFSEALEITNLIQDESNKVLVMINLADQYIKTGQTEKALKILSTTSKLVSSLHCSVC